MYVFIYCYLLVSHICYPEMSDHNEKCKTKLLIIINDLIDLTQCVNITSEIDFFIEESLCFGTWSCDPASLELQ